MAEPRAVLEPIVPEPGCFLAAAMARGEPGVPARFTWRGTRYDVVEVLDTRREVAPCYAGANETYARRHVTRVRVATGEVMTLSASRAGGRDAPRWVLRSVAATDVTARPALPEAARPTPRAGGRRATRPGTCRA